MRKSKQKSGGETLSEFSLREVKHHAARGIHTVLSAIENAIENGQTVLHEVWQWVATNFAKNIRAVALLKTHAPALAPATTFTNWREVIPNLYLPIRRKW
jgi:hypothetical protein